MSEKTRQKKDGQDTNKKNQRMREVNRPVDKKNASTRSQRRNAAGGAKD